MIASKVRCLQAVCNECEFVGNDREQKALFIFSESEQKNAMFASRSDYVCKLLHLQETGDLSSDFLQYVRNYSRKLEQHKRVNSGLERLQPLSMLLLNARDT
jgi:hypothetical protein